MMRPPKSELIKFFVDYSADTDFSASARLLQSKWREKRGFPYNGRFGNFLDVEFAKTTKENFLTQNIRHLVMNEVVKAKKIGAFISEPRIWDNLLSSQPLCFNLFGELHYDSDLATNYFKKLFPSIVEKVTAVKFEYSPGRRDLKYLGDNSAFDVFIEYLRDGKRGFIGIEVKYAESLREETRAIAAKNYKEGYAVITNECGLFKEECIGQLKEPPISQIWRDHLLAIATRRDYDEGFFVFLFPKGNVHCQAGVDLYRQYLGFDEEKKNGFYPRYLEDFLDTLVELAGTSWAIELRERYVGTGE